MVQTSVIFLHYTDRLMGSQEDCSENQNMNIKKLKSLSAWYIKKGIDLFLWCFAIIEAQLNRTELGINVSQQTRITARPLKKKLLFYISVNKTKDAS